MRKLYLYITGICIALNLQAQTMTTDSLGIFFGDYLILEEEATEEEIFSINSERPSTSVNDLSHIPSSYDIDTSKDLGEIPYKLNVDQGGNLNITVPVNLYKNPRGLTPEINMVYNSASTQRGIMGTGWNLGGVSTITRGNKSYYYDGYTEGQTTYSIHTNNPDITFILDGMRLIYLSTSSTNRFYETEDGNIKVTSYCISTSTMVEKYFEVFYPDGSKAIYGKKEGENINTIIYPLYEMTDKIGNKVKYSYKEEENSYLPEKIAYGENEKIAVEFTYIKDPYIYPKEVYIDGMKFGQTSILSNIKTKFQDQTLFIYEMTYESELFNNITQIDCKDSSGKKLNPLQFYYNKPPNSGVTTNQLDLKSSIKFNDPGEIRALRGKFDYSSDSDGIIMLPNKLNYYEYQTKTSRAIISDYNGNDKIFILPGIYDNSHTDATTITCGFGFDEIFCANVDGKERENIIKVNTIIQNGLERVQFEVYATDKSAPITLKKQYTRTFYLPTVIEYNGIPSVTPKQYFNGDFTGNGKSEILIVTAVNPLDQIQETFCYLIDLETEKILYQGSPFVFSMSLPIAGDVTVTPKEARKYSSKLYPIDYDGDGKTDLCLINGLGTHIFTFKKESSGYSMTKIKSDRVFLTISKLRDKEVFIGDFNGDGKSDLLVSPTESEKSTTWNLYLSKGDGSFANKTINLRRKAHMKDIIIQDMNNDGQSDITYRYTTADTYGFNYTYYIINGQVSSEETSTRSISTNPYKLLGTNPQSTNHYENVICLHNNSRITRMNYPSNLSKQLALAGIISSYGVITKVAYSPLNAYNSFTTGNDAVFPYVNYTGALMAVKDVFTYYKRDLISHMNYGYTNSVIHRQGLGFRGFSKIVCKDVLRAKEYTRTFSPYQHCTLTKEESDVGTTEYTYTHSVASNKIKKSRLTKTISNDKLAGTKTTTSYEYDTYGNPTKETVDYGDSNNKVITTNTYTNKTTTADYRLGLLTEQKVETYRDGSSITNKKVITYNNNYLPLTVKNTVGNGFSMSTETYEYDSKSNMTVSKVKKYTSNNELSESYTYDTWGRINKSTNPMGHSKQYTYNSKGLISKETDHKGNVTSYTYDNRGKMTKVTHPDGTTTTFSSKWIDDQPQTAIYYSSEIHSNQAERQIFYDAFGRTVKTGEKRFDGVFLYVDIRYDNLGRMVRKSEPGRDYPPFIWQTYTYDDYDRVISKTTNVKTVTCSYNKLQETTTINGVNYVKTYDAAGFLTKVTDPGGDITYTYRPDGQVSAITAPGNIKTTFTYDSYGRKYSITDPSAGMHQFRYDADGNMNLINLPTGKTTNIEYDKYGRITKKTFNGDFSSTYTYNNDGTLASIVGNNGTKVEYTYDNYQRVLSEKESIGYYYLTQEYDYADGHLKGINYYLDILPYSRLGREEYRYANGHLTEILFNPGRITPITTVWKLTQENVLGYSMKELLNNNEVSYSTHVDGVPGSQTFTRNGTTYNYIYNRQSHTRNLLSRIDTNRNREEKFEYDNLDRLTKMTTGIKNGSSKTYTLSYNTQGTRTKHTGIGTYTTNSSNPYQTTKVTPTNNNLVVNDIREITYNSLNLPKTIKQGSFEAAFEYNYNMQRSKMVVKEKAANGIDDKSVTTKLYFGNKFEIEIKTGEKDKRRLYIGGDCYSARCVYTMENVNGATYYLWRDHLGSMTHIVNDKEMKEQSYDPWGLLRNPENHEVYQAGKEPELFLGRGYTGHEHLPWFGLINMNARLYDPALGSFISPDPYVQAPDFTQNFNRYSYCMNNPLKYVDPSGEIAWFVPIIAGAVAGAYTGASLQSGTAAFWNWKSDAWKGAIAGGFIGASLGGMVSSAIGASGVLSSSLEVTKTFGTTTAILNSASANIGINSIYGGGWESAWKAGITGAASGAWTITGGFSMVKGFNSTNKLAKLGSKLSYQMIGTAGRSMGNNWIFGKNPFSSVALGTGPVNINVGKNSKLFNWKNNVGNILTNTVGLSNLAFGGKVSFDWENLSFNYSGGILDKCFNPLTDGPVGYGSYSVMGNSRVNELYGHELHHLWQSRSMGDIFLLNYTMQGISGMLIDKTWEGFIYDMNYFEEQAYGHYWWPE